MPNVPGSCSIVDSVGPSVSSEHSVASVVVVVDPVVLGVGVPVVSSSHTVGSVVLVVDSVVLLVDSVVLLVVLSVVDDDVGSVTDGSGSQ